MKSETDEQRRIVVGYLDGSQAKVNALREPHKGVILQSQSQSFEFRGRRT